MGGREGLEAEASRLLDKLKWLDEEELAAFKYMVENVSVGILRARQELKTRLSRSPEEVLRRLASMGLVEEGEECYNLALPLRRLASVRGKSYIESIISRT